MEETGCSIVSDGWTDKKRRSIINFMVNSHEGTIFLSSIDASNVSHAKEKICEMLDAIVEKSRGGKRCSSCNRQCCKLQGCRRVINAKEREVILDTLCSALMDVILEEFEKKLNLHKATIAEARRITTYIYAKQLFISILRHFTKGRDLIRPAVTRSATAYLTLGSLSVNELSLQTISSTQDGKRIEQMVLDSRFWTNIVICLKAAFPLIKVLRMVDGKDKPAMGFIYDEMDKAKSKIRANFSNVKKNYEPICDIIDKRWELQQHRPLHAAAYYLNPQIHYSPDFIRMVPNSKERKIIDFKSASGLFSLDATKDYGLKTISVVGFLW